MSRLGVYISVLLTLAILVVVGGATLLTIRMVGPPRHAQAESRRAAELALVAHALERLPADEISRLIARGGLSLTDGSPAGREIAPATRELVEALRRDGVTAEARVVAPEQGGPPSFAMKLTDGRWLTIEAGPPPPDGRAWGAFAFWMALIAAGVAAAVVFAVMRATRPLAMLERAVAAVGPDGEFSELPETGPPEVRSTARAINRLSSRLKSAMESRMRLVAAAGHDLRTPMTRMRLRAEFIPQEEERERWLADLAELDRIADSAIQLVREEVDPDARQPTRIDLMVGEIVDELVEIRLPIALTRAAPAEALVRPHSMKRALRNLALNAATHGVRARASVELSRGAVVIVIEDEGPGIPPHLLQQAFEPFFRVDPARQTLGAGAGLGLAIAKEIVDRNGGELSIANRPGEGLAQMVRLPAATADQSEY